MAGSAFVRRAAGQSLLRDVRHRPDRSPHPHHSARLGHFRPGLSVVAGMLHDEAVVTALYAFRIGRGTR